MKFKHIHQKNIYVVSLILRGHISLFFPYNTVTIFVRGKEKINSGKKVLLSYMKENAFLSEKLFFILLRLSDIPRKLSNRN